MIAPSSSSRPVGAMTAARVLDGSVAMRRFLLVAIVFGGASGAHAADLPDFPALRGTYTDVPSSTRINWQGFYIGGQAAYGSTNSKPIPSNTDLQDTFVPPTGFSYSWATLGPA